MLCSRINNNNFGRTDDVAGIIIGSDREEFDNECIVQVDLCTFSKVVVSEYILEFTLAGAVEIGDLGDQRVGAYRILGGYGCLVEADANRKEVPVAERTPAVLKFQHERNRIAFSEAIGARGFERKFGMG